LVTVPQVVWNRLELLALQTHVLSICGQEEAERFQAGILDLILKVRRHPPALR
jgi:hypothetical protein